MNERKGFSIAGIPFIGVCLVLAAIGLLLLVSTDGARPETHVIPGILLLALTGFLAKGFFQVAPNEAQAMQLFGRYAGSVREEGLRWTNPFYSKRPVSLRVRNFESSKLKVNDSDGNPIEIAAVIVWQVVDTAEAVFQVDRSEERRVGTEWR